MKLKDLPSDAVFDLLKMSAQLSSMAFFEALKTCLGIEQASLMLLLQLRRVL